MTIKGWRVDAYMNLQKDCYSIKCMEPGSMYPYGRVTDHVDAVTISDPEFIVHPSGLEKYRETGVRNVHAFVRGTVETINDEAGFGGYRAWAFDYKPLVHDDLDCPFVLHDDEVHPVSREDPDRVYLDERGQYALFDYTADDE